MALKWLWVLGLRSSTTWSYRLHRLWPCGTPCSRGRAHAPSHGIIESCRGWSRAFAESESRTPRAPNAHDTASAHPWSNYRIWLCLWMLCGRLLCKLAGSRATSSTRWTSHPHSPLPGCLLAHPVRVSGLDLTHRGRWDCLRCLWWLWWGFLFVAKIPSNSRHYTQQSPSVRAYFHRTWT